MIKRIILAINTRKLKKMHDENVSEWDIVAEIRHLTNAGFSDSQALAVINAIANWRG